MPTTTSLDGGARDHRRRPRRGRRGAARADRALRRVPRSTTSACPPPTCGAALDARRARAARRARVRRRARSARTTRPSVAARRRRSSATAIAPARARSSRSTAPGCYVPGGRAAYPSTVLMTAIPARVAGVPELVLCVPPDADGTVAGATLAAAALAGVDEVYRVGGAQAIAALAYGTEIDPAGRRDRRARATRYVAAAKREVAGVVGIESLAGPSEVVVVADGTAPADVRRRRPARAGRARPRRRRRSSSRGTPTVADAVDAALDELLADAPRRAEIEATLAQRWPDRARRRRRTPRSTSVNVIAPEHLELMTDDPDALVAARAQRGRGVRRPVGAGRARRLRRGRRTTCCPPRAPRGSRARCGSTLPQARPRGRASTPTALAARRAARRGARRGRGPRRARALGRRCASVRP